LRLFYGFSLRAVAGMVEGKDPAIAILKAAVDTAQPFLPQPPLPAPPTAADFAAAYRDSKDRTTQATPKPPHPKQAKIDALEARALDSGATEEEQRTSALAALRLRRGNKPK
jgi:hypothetical protein